MQPLVSLAAALAAALPFVQSQTLTISISALTPSPSASSQICPSSDGQLVTDALGAKYQVHCGSYLVSSTFYHEPTPLSDRECIAACGRKTGCLGAVWYPPGHCELATGASVTIKRSPGFDAFVAVAPASSPSVSARTSSGHGQSFTSLRQSTSTPTVTTFLSPLPTDDHTTSCSFINLDCPVCDSQTIPDAFGNLYTVHCDSAIFADGVHDVSRNTSPEGCVEQCDGYPWCLGATWHSGGNCELARTGHAAPFGMPGYIAFMPVAATSSSSIRPTITSNHSSTSSVYTTTSSTDSTASISSSAPTSQATCDTATVSCPTCEGSVVTNVLGQDYLTQCYIRPSCNSTANPIGLFTAERCLEQCDADATCLAAIYNNGTCDLCQQDIVSIASLSRAVSGYAVFLSPVLWQTEDPHSPILSSSSNLIPTSSAFASVSIRPTPLLATTSSTIRRSTFARTSSSTTMSDPIMSILPFPALSEPISSTATDPIMSILPFPLASEPAISTTSEQMFSILPFPAQSETVTATTPDQIMSILPFPALPQPAPSTTTTEQVFSILPFPVFTEQTASITVASRPSITSFRPMKYDPPTATVPLTRTLMPNMSSIDCPTDQNLAVYDEESSRPYQMKCDACFQAAQHSLVSASDFAACAALCTAKCDGVQYSSTFCGLMTGISVLSYRAHATAAAVMVVSTETNTPQARVSITATFGELSTSSVSSNTLSRLPSAGKGPVTITSTFRA